jgi:hypothetical protein
MITMKPVESSAMKAWGYDPAQQVLAIQFRVGKITHYQGVPQDVADAFEAAPSKGQAVGELLRGRYPTTVVVDEAGTA